MSNRTSRISQQDQNQILADYLPGGRAFGAKNIPGTNLRRLIIGLAKEMFTISEVLHLYRDEILPDVTTDFLVDWEKALGIPDDCYSGTGTTADRRLSVLTKIARSGLQVGQDYVNFAAIFGIVCRADPVLTVHPGTIPVIKTARFTIVIDFDLEQDNEFTYTFTLTFGSSTLNMIKCLFETLKPANVDLLFTNI